MSNWGTKLLCLAGLLVVAAGCDETKRLRQENLDLRSANAKLQADLKQLQDEKAALEAANRDLLAQLRAKDETIATLQGLKVPQPPPLPTPSPTPVAKNDKDGLEGLDVDRNANAITVNVAGDVLFDSGKATLKAGALATLDKIAAALKAKYPTNKVRVVGHTDNDPIKKSGWKDNWELSSARAQAVGNYLAKQGVTNKMEVVGVANTEPRVPEKTRDDKAKNRRVGVEVMLQK